MKIHTHQGKWLALITSTFLLILCMLGSVLLGYTDTSIQTAVQAFSHPTGVFDQLVVTEVRLPRALIGAAIGGALAVAGALMQALTRNPMASPDFIGVNAGASFFIVAAMMLFSVTSLEAFLWIGLIGSAVTSLAVYLLGSMGSGGLSPLKITLAGAATAMLFASMTQGLLVLDESALDQVMFWLAGSIEGRKLELLQLVIPYLTVGFLIALFLGKSINVLQMGEDVATGLGQKTWLVKLLGLVSIVLLAGSAVSVAGPISFIGVMVPHIAKGLVGHDYRWLVPFSITIGGIVLVLADISARFVMMPEEVPVGVMTALIGIPFFLAVARRGVGKA
ncbi:iron complex transport system permease protein [Thermoactinomyces sp. DSM 45891]|uniref:FecCD family ABC transporter permease n=1 Tax=Thermoactinomyces sp. DSM 45891 TaxID=1761907 RepID=UPI000912518A|nr:iron ABC transporter permease [Thermoactinomyces sp. DSM 45891]SFX03031.1 iron complex transport system permease protein [Thermoactinomyces sp. DSM 45891]